jgi:hypothetical protein
MDSVHPSHLATFNSFKNPMPRQTPTFFDIAIGFDKGSVLDRIGAGRRCDQAARWVPPKRFTFGIRGQATSGSNTVSFFGVSSSKQDQRSRDRSLTLTSIWPKYLQQFQDSAENAPILPTSV